METIVDKKNFLGIHSQKSFSLPISSQNLFGVCFSSSVLGSSDVGQSLCNALYCFSSSCCIMQSTVLHVVNVILLYCTYLIININMSHTHDSLMAFHCCPFCIVN